LTTTTLTTTTVSTAATGTTTTWTITPWAFAAGIWRRRRGSFSFGKHPAVHPAFDTNDAVNGPGFSETVVDGHAEGLERHFAFFIPFGAGNISTTQAACGADTNPKRTKFHSRLERALHGTAEGNTAFKLSGDVFSNQLGFKFRLLDFKNIDFDLFTPAHLADGGVHDLDF
jgi:hypothetical protein